MGYLMGKQQILREDTFMKSQFENKTCGKCGSHNLAHFAEWYSGQIPAGIEGFIGCRECQYWERILTLADAADVFDGDHWIVLKAGQGSFSREEEQDKTITYQDPEESKYPRFGVGQR
jgi:hypothetical protein